MNVIKNLKIRDKLLLLLSLLLFPLVYFVFNAVQLEIEENNRLNNEAVQLAESEKLSNVIHEFQRERARMIASVGGNEDYLLAAKTQRTVTDAAERDLKQFLEKTGRSFSDISLLHSLQEYRNDVDKDKLDVPKFRSYSEDLIYAFLGRIDSNANGVGDEDLSQEMLSLRSLIEAKIQLARMRSLLMKVMQEGVFDFEDYAEMRSHKRFYERALVDFDRFASSNTSAEVASVLSSDNYRQIALMLQRIDRDPGTSFDPENAVPVFNNFTTSIEDFRQVEKSLLDSITVQVANEIRQKHQYLIVLAIAAIVLLLLMSWLSFYIVSLISNSLAKLKVAADRIRLGATNVEIGVNSKDEVGLVADSFRGVLNKNVSLTKVAQAIGEGNYEVEVEVQSEEDGLSFAIKDMKENLQRFSTDNANRSWILAGISELNDLLTGITVLDEISEKVVVFLCNYTGSEAGILYLHEEGGRLSPKATYGVQYSAAQLDSFKIGVGVVGQAVSERQVKLLHEVPDANLKIKTGLSESDPANIIILPLQFTENLVGAIELCSRTAYNDLYQQFFKAASERVAVMIHTLKIHLQTQELLYETQNQAEELETQQEELRQLNAELKASEEELRVNQEELQEKNSELEEKAQLLEEQYEALRGKNDALEDARQAIELKINQVETVSKYKSDFLANMSHELRTPLNSILILSRLLADNTENTLSTKQVDHAQIIHRSGNDLLKLINEILDLSKIESGLVRLEVNETRTTDIQMEQIFGEVARKRNIRFTQHIAPDMYDTLVTDRFRLEQILKNFIGNALKFTDEGGEVEFSIYPVRNKPRFKTDSLKEHQEIIAFSVKDTGIGIPKDKQEMVFEAFQQADSSTTRRYGGTGLGLTISKELATILGGELQLESEPGVGSTFTLYLPRTPHEQPQPQQVQPQQAGTPLALPATPVSPKSDSVVQVLQRITSRDKKEIKVLIVEDDKGFSDILADFATAKNFTVFKAYTGADGLALAKAEQPDAILLDIHLPDTTGWDVLREIREDKDLRHINVHVMSAYDSEVTGEFQENEEYLPKPVTLEMLNKAFTTIAGITDGAIENILIVEDNEIENKAVAELLLAHGMRSTSVYTAEEAERVLAKQKVDCIILDLNLPGMKGYEFMRAIKSKEGLASIPIVVYSGKDLSEEEETKLKEFANTIIIKNEYSYLRLLDEVQLFLHKVNQKLPLGNEFKMKLHVPEQILKDRKILVVDDDVRNVYSLSSLLELHGMEAVVAYDGKEALQKLETETDVDMVLMDIMMPEMDGIEAIKRIRKNTKHKRMPIIALTAKAMKEDKEKCIKAGASDYIPKPIDTDKLLTLMRVWLYEG
ncbi:response regulator [Pontibacter qinzhouensis]|uniref:histidine kinase n=1 Tax=Pontibacter qinzhouensis TaxID=2603253 RepID=A0A5C8KAI8_9BACT|nr:response regulator [Pontibacter qinzhouensis]TXK48751.1 response regulator [Pontibacter qinzhouensis]